MRRTNDELVAGWGNLVNRTATMIAKNFGEIPAAGPLEPVDEAVLAAVRAGFATVGDLLGRHRLRAAIAEAMRVVGEANKYLTDTEPYKLKDDRTASGSAPCCTWPPRACSTATRCWRRSCRSRRSRCDGLGGRGRVHADAADRRGRGPRPDDGAGLHLPDHHRRLLFDAALGDGGR